ncbi:hypothetical protein [Kitasatospora sp. NPDC093558]|uniref:hypothetical protein n=1 Tax=Kitasatospora sp. NPDC093558 TaxID=3155201 RepID=UPI003432A1F1
MSTGEPTVDETAAARRLGELAGSVEIGPAPYDRLVAGGRRRLRRRRLLGTGAAAVVVAVAVGGVTALGGFGASGRGAGDPAFTVAAPPSATASATAPATPTATTPATPTAPARDPFTPIRTMVGHGTVGGKEWQAWAALWPATATKQDARRQAELMYEDRHAAIPQLPKPVDADTDRSWQTGLDLVNLYLTVDGKRQVDDSVHDAPAPGILGATAPAVDHHPVSASGTMLGFKGGEMGAAPVVIAEVRRDVAKVVITWDDGSTSEAVPTVVGDSPTHWYAIAKKPGAEVDTYKYLGADGSVLGSDAQWFRHS